MPDVPNRPPLLTRAHDPIGDPRPTAVVYCEANFGAPDGKTANGLVRHSERYRILSVIDSRQAGRDAGEVLGDGPNDIPVVADLEASISSAGSAPDYLVFGMAPASGMLSVDERRVMGRYPVRLRIDRSLRRMSLSTLGCCLPSTCRPVLARCVSTPCRPNTTCLR